METSDNDTLLKNSHGNDILRCIQCGSCSGSCPFGDQMTHGPRQIFALIRDGAMAEVLSANTQWFCSSCYQCMDRCPMEIPVTDIMYELKQLAIQLGKAPSDNKMPDLYRAFTRNLNRYGRVTDPMVMADYSLKHPMDAIKSVPLAVRLTLRGRLDLIPQRREKQPAPSGD